MLIAWALNGRIIRCSTFAAPEIIEPKMGKGTCVRPSEASSPEPETLLEGRAVFGATRV